MSRIYNILNTLINKVQFKVMSQTIGGENTVEGCLNALNSKTALTLTPSSNVTNFEASLSRNSKVLIGYVVFKATANMKDNDEIVSAGIPDVYRNNQLPLICVGGTQAGQVGRCLIENGKIIIYYSNLEPKTDNTYLIPVTAMAM